MSVELCISAPLPQQEHHKKQALLTVSCLGPFPFLTHVHASQRATPQSPRVVLGIVVTVRVTLLESWLEGTVFLLNQQNIISF